MEGHGTAFRESLDAPHRAGGGLAETLDPGPSGCILGTKSAPDHLVAMGDAELEQLAVDLQRVIAERFGIVYAERSISRLLAELGFVHISARPQHPAQNPKVIEAYKKTSRARLQRT